MPSDNLKNADQAHLAGRPARGIDLDKDPLVRQKEAPSLPGHRPAQAFTGSAESCFPIVGIGASIGDLEALEAFFKALPDDCGMAFVVVTHTNPGKAGRLPAIVERNTSLVVLQIEDGMPAAPNTIYLAPPELGVVLEGTTFRLGKQPARCAVPMPADLFLKSLAHERGERAACVILAGAGADGTAGLCCIKEHAGLTLVQDPETARHAGMPSSAIASGMADIVTTAEKIPGRVVDYFRRLELRNLAHALELAQADLSGRNTALRQITRDLAMARDAYLDLYETAPVAFVALNAKGRVERANAAARHILGGNADALVGRDFSQFVTGEDQRRYFSAMRKVAATNSLQRFDLRLARQAHAPLHVHVQAAPKFDAEGDFQYWHLAIFDTSDLRRREAELAQAHAQLQMAARAAQLGTWNFDLEKGITQWDRGLYRLLGLKPREGPEDGNYFFEFIHPDDRRGLLASLQNLLDRDDNAIREEFRVVRADGEIRWLAARGRIFRDAHGRPRHIAGINFDITDRKQTEETVRLAQLQMVRQLSETERANQELSQYAYAVSHDLKEPLRAVRNYADFLYEDLADTLTGEQKKYLDGMRRAVRQGDALIDDLLSLSRIDNMELDREKADVPGIVREIRSLLGVASDLEIEVESTWPDFYADHMVLKQILQNLISNAVKFNRHNPRRVQVGWQPAPEDGIEIIVRDNGIGIAPHYHEQIFRIFQRLHTKQEYEGTGIGLAIVRKAAHKLGGNVRVESEAGRGSTFYVLLPREMSSP